jgi:pSer/pThr/pTyr-binding forkhead associated (FHA) protein
MNMKAYLVYKARVFPISKESVKLGRDLENTLVLSDKAISRFHAEILFENNRFHLKDLNSTGGTFLNDVPVVGMAELDTKDEISLAGVHMTFYTDEDQLDIDTKLRTGALKKYVLLEEDED